MVAERQSYQWFRTSVLSMIPDHQSYQWFPNISLINGSQTSVLAIVLENRLTAVAFKIPENLKGSIV